MMTRESDCFAIECVLGNIFWFADKERFWQSGNHKEQRTGFNSFFSRFPNERRIFLQHGREKRERKRKNGEEKSPTVHHAHKRR